MSPLEPRLRPKEVLGLVNVQRPKKSKSKVGTSKPNDVQKGSKKSAEDLDKLIKIEKRLLPFNDHLPNFLYGPIKALKWKKDYTGEVSTKKAAKDEAKVEPDLPLIVYNPLFQDIPIEENAGKMSSKEEVQPDG
ncbi:hypothetical protein E5676_scaffold1312G00140 [Cucumis melo var. makuwa]|uniref:Uncharacterized protein n=1 Tax=Cucumis melo var. makuwa TaxID=1194695 RepID=A0A5A7UQ22_CUCMM|nr:hypothetical protein E6C27_scaffold29G00210 [Cucumis melo var. makuwa]TYK21191.1 hypothetical protein E5676_scaffold1312G00140 [Cucumis melo var. makuwa]